MSGGINPQTNLPPLDQSGLPLPRRTRDRTLILAVLPIWTGLEYVDKRLLGCQVGRSLLFQSENQS